MSDGGNAFPFWYQGPTTGPQVEFGMSLRDYFAAKAMEGLIANTASTTGQVTDPPWRLQGFNKWVAECSYAMSDAMLTERSKAT